MTSRPIARATTDPIVDLELEARRRLRERCRSSAAVYDFWCSFAGRLRTEMAAVEAERAATGDRVTQSWRENARRAVPR